MMKLTCLSIHKLAEIFWINSEVKAVNILRVNSSENLEKNPKNDEKMFLKSAKNVFLMVIGPVEFRNTGYFQKRPL